MSERYPFDNKLPPAKYAKDHGDGVTLGDVVGRIADAYDRAGTLAACDVIDVEFLGGCWHNELNDREPPLLRDLRGIILAMYKLGQERRNV